MCEYLWMFVLAELAAAAVIVAVIALRWRERRAFDRWLKETSHVD
jgi:hypothetical protein